MTDGNSSLVWFDRLFEVYRCLAEERGEHAPRALLRENALRFYGI
jgi:hypothetical protein